MDIPNTGAIFTLGKSHLAENTQSYFYIKNDPIKRVISGPQQSAVICESGRLFVWGENSYGQLGISGNTHNHDGNDNNNKGTNKNASANRNDHNIKSNNNNNNSDLVTKPTCVKSLKTLGLKIADIAFGKNWAVILTHSNEIFFTGCNIFNEYQSNFIETEVAGVKFSIIRKPFRLERFDDCLSCSEEEENFVSVLAGNEHFAVMTSSGRLFGWGSNAYHQLGQSDTEVKNGPLEIILDAPIQQFTCGPESTLVLTASGSLYLTGRLNEFVCPQFTELQKNLSQNEQIIFMHISKASDIFIVTTTGGIYRSFETVRNKSLVFQRFYDYDSEENGPILKLLKGYSFYAVLTKANKFYTTFSESGHHLKTFREISKFKNLRLVDVAVGDQHILVHGIPRTSTLSGLLSAGGELKCMSRSGIKSQDNNGDLKRSNSGSNRKKEIALDETSVIKEKSEDIERNNVKDNEISKPNIPLREDKTEGKNEQLSIDNGNTKEQGSEVIDNKNALKPQMSFIQTTNIAHSPTGSHKSGRSIKFEDVFIENTSKSDSPQGVRRPHTPYPDSSASNTPQTAKKAIRQFSYEKAMTNDAIENTTPALHDSPGTNITDDISSTQKRTVFNSHNKIPTPPYEEDEELTVEIETVTDELDQTIINDIRFINNGVDVTPTVDTKISEDSDSDGSGEDIPETGKKGTKLLQTAQQGMKKTFELTSADSTREAIEKGFDKASNEMGEEIQTESPPNSNKTKESAAHKVVKDMLNAVDVEEETEQQTSIAPSTIRNQVKKSTTELSQTMNNLSLKALDAVSDAKQMMGKAMSGTKQALSSISSKNSSVRDQSTLLSPTSHKSPDRDNRDGNEITKIDSSDPALKERLKTTLIEDDERTTASVNSNHTPSEVPSEGENPFGDGTHLSNDLERVADKYQIQAEPEHAKSKVRQFFDDIKSKGKGISCSSEKNIRIDDDEPPRYTPVEDPSRNYGSSGEINSNSNTSKVCTIL